MKNLLSAAVKALPWVIIPALAVKFLDLSYWVILGGMCALIVAHEFGHWFVAKVLGFEVSVFSVGLGSRPRFVFGRFWGTEFQVTPWLIGGYVKIDPAAADFRTKVAWKRAAVLVAGVIMNVLLSLVIIFCLFASVGQRQAAYESILVNKVSDQITRARDSGMRPGDQFVSIDGQAIKSPLDIQRVLKGHKGAPVTVVLKSGGTDVSVSVTPNSDGRIGVEFGGKVVPVYVKMSPGQAAVESVKFTRDVGKQMLVGLGMMLKIVPPPAGAPDGATDVHGLVAIFQLGAMAFQNGLYEFLLMLSLYSMNLAFFNILPIPMLDGGHLAFLGWEKVIGKPFSRQTQGFISRLFLMLLLMLMALGLFNDLFRPVKFK